MTDNTILYSGQLLSQLKQTQLKGLESGALEPLETEKSVFKDTTSCTSIPYELRQLSSLRKKPRSSTSATPVNPFLPYGQDLYVGHISTGHVILLNKFNVVAHHFLIVTPEFETQEDLLAEKEFTALSSVLPAFPMLAFYNSGRVAGGSQPHRHLQVIPIQALPVESVLNDIQCVPHHQAGLPYRHLMTNIESCSTEQCYSLYLEMLEQLELWQPGMDQPKPYNLLMTSHWMLVVPRTHDRVEGISVNALGFAGLLLVKNKQQMAKLRKIHPARLLQQASE